MATTELPNFAILAAIRVGVPDISPASAVGAPISDYTFWINVSLAAATLAVTCVALVVAVSAFIGYQAMRRMIRRQTQKHARTATDEYLQGSQFREKVRILVEEATRDQIKNRITISLSTTDGNPSEAPRKTEVKDE